MYGDEADKIEQVKRNRVWGTCVDCPQEDGKTYPERCIHFGRADHKLSADDLIEYLERVLLNL
jgi:hypothetical protein